MYLFVIRVQANLNSYEAVEEIRRYPVIQAIKTCVITKMNLDMGVFLTMKTFPIAAFDNS